MPWTPSAVFILRYDGSIVGRYNDYPSAEIGYINYAANLGDWEIEALDICEGVRYAFEPEEEEV